MQKFLMLFLFLAVTLVSPVSGQSNPKGKGTKPHKIVFQLVSKDTSDHNALVRQLNNILKLTPNAKLEVVCHGPGLTFIQKDKSKVLDQLASLAAKEVDFVACEFTMQQKNIKREQLIDACRTVPGGILEIVGRQEKGWSYIKAGY